MALFRADGKVHRLEIGTGAPLRDPARIRELFEERLAVLGDACDPGFGYDMVRLAALVTERCDPAQTGLAGPDHAEELAHLIDRLGARFGLRRVTRLVPQDTHIPEYAVAAVPAASFTVPRDMRLATAPQRLALRGGREVAASSECSTPLPNPPPQGEGATEATTDLLASEQDSLAPARPLRLFERPEPIEAIARCRTARRCVSPGGTCARVAHVEGPERIAMEWWRDDRATR